MAIVRRLEQDRLRVKRDRVSHIANDYATDIQRNMERTLSVGQPTRPLFISFQITKVSTLKLSPLNPTR